MMEKRLCYLVVPGRFKWLCDKPKLSGKADERNGAGLRPLNMPGGMVPGKWERRKNAPRSVFHNSILKAIRAGKKNETAMAQTRGRSGSA